MSNNAILVVVLTLAATAMIVQAQMTFSDGWGKRSAPSHHRLAPSSSSNNKEALIEALSGNGQRDLLMDVGMDVCYSAYSQSLAHLHQKILALYEGYQKCQDKANVKVIAL